MWELPKAITLNNIMYKITDNCDYRVILDCWKSLKNTELTAVEQITEALFIFCEDFVEISKLGTEAYNEAVKQMIEIMDGDRNTQHANKPILKPIVDFEKDFPLIVSALLPILGCDIREAKYLHWWSFLSAFREIKDGVYAEVLRIRLKRSKGMPLDKDEQKFYRENRDIVDIDYELTDEEKEFLFSD